MTYVKVISKTYLNENGHQRIIPCALYYDTFCIFKHNNNDIIMPLLSKQKRSIKPARMAVRPTCV